MNAQEFTQIFPLGVKNDTYAQFFSGQSYIAMLTMEGIASFNVTFEPGCRNNWHIHHRGGQVLYCTAGKGWYQQEGKPAQSLKPGDVVVIPAGAKHWHGATEGSTNEWLEPVSDNVYSQLG